MNYACKQECAVIRFTSMDAKEMQSAGGRARAAKLTQERKSEIARQAATERWKGHIKKGKRKADNVGEKP